MIFFLLLTGCDNSFNYNDPTEVPDNPDIVEEKYLSSFYIYTFLYSVLIIHLSVQKGRLGSSALLNKFTPELIEQPYRCFLLHERISVSRQRYLSDYSFNT